MSDDANRWVVGSIGVKVRPYTDDFHKDLKADLIKEQKRIDPLLAEVDPDTRHLLREANRAIEAVNVRLNDIRAKVNVDKTSAIAAVNDVQRTLDRLRDKKVNIDAGVDEHGLRQLQRQLDAVERYRDAQRELTKAQEEWHDARRRGLHIRGVESDLRTLGEIDDRLRRARTAMDDLRKDADVQLGFKLNDKELDKARRLVDDFRDYVDPKRTIEIEVEPDLRSIQNAQRQIDRMLGDDGAFNFKVSADPEDLRRLRRHLEDLKDDYNNTELDFEPVIDGLNSRFVSMRLAYLARDRWVTFRPILDNKAFQSVATSLAALSGLRMLDATFENIWDWVKNLDKNIPLVAGVTLAVMGLTASLLSSTSNLLAFSRSLAQVSGAALALPGIMGGFAIGIGATIAVMRDFNDALPGVREQLSELQDQMSSRFWARAAAPMRRAIDSLMVPFSEGIRETSADLGNWFAEMARAVDQYVGRSMPFMFRNLNESIRISAQGADDFAQIIEILGKHGSEYLPRLATWGNRVQKSFRDWLDEADRTGRLTHFIELGLEQMHQLGRVLRHTGGILTDLAIAAEKAGGSTLKMLADQLEDIHAVTGSKKFQDGMIRTFESAHEAMRRIADVSGPRVSYFFENLSYLFERGMPVIGDSIGHLIGGITEALSTDRFNEGFARMLEGIRSGVQSLDPVWSTIGDGLGALGSIIGDLAEHFGPLLAEALRLAAEAAERFQPTLERIIDSLSGRVLDILERVGPVALDLADALLRLVEPLIKMPVLLEAVVVGFGLWKMAAWAAGVGKMVTGVTGLYNTIRKLPQVLGRGGTAVGRFAGSLGKLAGAATVAFAALPVGKHIADAITGFEPQIPTVELLTSRFTQLGDGMSAFDAILADLELHRFTDFRDSVHDLANLSGLDKFLHNLGLSATRSEEAAEAFAVAGQALATVAREDLAAAQEQFNQLVIEAGGTDQAAQDLLKLMPAWRSRLEQVAIASGMATDETTILKLAMGALSGETEETRAATELLNGEMLGMPDGMKVASSSMGLYEEAMRRVNGVTPSLIGSIEEAARSFIDLSEGLDAENFSLGGWLDQLEQQVADMQTWADNMAIIAQEGNEQVTAALRDLGPAGASAVAELADELEAGGTESFDRLAEVVHMGTDGVILGMDGKFGELASAVDGHMAAAELAVAMGMSSMSGTSATGGRNILESLRSGMSAATPEVAAAMETVEAAIEGDLVALRTLASPAGAEMIELLASGIDSRRSSVEGSAANVASEAIDALKAWHDQANGVGADGAQGFINGLTSKQGEVSSAAGNLATTATVAVASLLEVRSPSRVMHRLGSFAGQGIIGGLLAQLNAVRDAAKSMVNSMLHAWRRISSDAQASGKAAGTGFAKGIAGQSKSASSAARSLANAVSGGARTSYGSMASAGSYAGAGFAAGVRGRWSAAYNAGRSLGQAANAGARAALAIRSPSRVMMEVGHFTGEGMVVGLNDMQGKVASAAERLAEAAARGAAGRNLRVESEMAVRDARGEPGRFEGATVYQTVYNPVERSSSEELNAGLQTLDVLVP